MLSLRQINTDFAFVHAWHARPCFPTAAVDVSIIQAANLLQILPRHVPAQAPAGLDVSGLDLIAANDFLIPAHALIQVIGFRPALGEPAMVKP